MTIEFLGFVLNPEGIQMDKNKVKVIQDWPTPRQMKDIQAFLLYQLIPVTGIKPTVSVVSD